MPKKYSDEQKLNALACIESGEDLKDIVEKLGIAYPTLLKWRNELHDAKTNGDIQNLIDVDEVIVKRIANETAKDLANLADDTKDIAEIERAVEGTLESIDGYNLLNTKLQTVALKAATRVGTLIDDHPGIGDLKLLVETLAQIQNAFFNKPTTNVNIANNMQQISNTQVSNFKGMKRA